MKEALTLKQKDLLERNAAYWAGDGDKVEASENREFLSDAIAIALNNSERCERLEGELHAIMANDRVAGRDARDKATSAYRIARDALGGS